MLDVLKDARKYNSNFIYVDVYINLEKKTCVPNIIAWCLLNIYVGIIWFL